MVIRRFASASSTSDQTSSSNISPSVVWRVRRPSVTSVPISKDVHDLYRYHTEPVRDVLCHWVACMLR